ncbi:MAG TPA: hypothetical protein VD788_05955 [Candidatus Polarisedimenticolaceae bacterium]|nr:hypothetical protein [Candidatus Polarisedimenticolaceae bacterium]
MARFSLIALAISSPVLLLALLVGGEAGGFVFAVVAPIVPVGLMALGRDGGPRRFGVVVWLGLLWLSLEAGTLGILFATGRTGGWLGLPAATVWMLVGLGIVPLLLVPWGFAWLWRDEGPDATRSRR